MSDFSALQEYVVTDILQPIRYKIIKLTQMIRVVAKFVFRQVPAGAASGYANIEKVEGNTVAWNQLLKQGKLVDMGLPSGLLWATCNIDITQEDGFAASPFQYGCTMFSWGNIEGHNTPASGTTFDYNWGGVNAQEPWYEGQPYGSTPGSTLTADIVAGDTYDSARYNLGSLFKMPASAQFQELFNNCDFVQADGTTVITSTDKRVTVNGIVGIYLKSKINGNLIFFSASGIGNNSSWNNSGANGLYWSSSLYSSRNARYLSFYSGGVNPQNNGNSGRYNGFAVRAVVNPNTIDTGHNNHKYYVTKDINHDLTAIFGAGNEPTTVADFEAWMAQNIGTLPYYDYNAGELLSCKMESLKSIGFNQLDEQMELGDIAGGQPSPSSTHYRSVNFSRIFGGKWYYFKVPNLIFIFWYDSAKNYISYSEVLNSRQIKTPDNAAYLKINDRTKATYNHDICINISDPTKNGTYQPYKTDSADIDVTTITGINPNTNTREVIFPNGMKQADYAGTVKDEIDLMNGTATVKCWKDDLTNKTWTTKYTGSVNKTISATLDKVNNRVTSKYLSSKYNFIRNVNAVVLLNNPDNLEVGLYPYYNTVYPNDRTCYLVVPISETSFGDVCYELATPITYTDLQDANGNPLNPRYKVEQGGTEQILPANTSTPTTVAPTLTTTYTKDVH